MKSISLTSDPFSSDKKKYNHTQEKNKQRIINVKMTDYESNISKKHDETTFGNPAPASTPTYLEQDLESEISITDL